MNNQTKKPTKSEPQTNVAFTLITYLSIIAALIGLLMFIILR